MQPLLSHCDIAKKKSYNVYMTHVLSDVMWRLENRDFEAEAI